MNKVLFIFLLVITAVMTARNLQASKRYRKDKEYTNAYASLLKDEEQARDKINEFIDSSKDEENRNKGLILKIYDDMEKGLTVYEDLECLNFGAIFFNNGRFIKQRYQFNSDCFLWLTLTMAKGRSQSKFDVVDKLYEKVSILPLENFCEYQLVKSAYGIFREKNDGSIDFLRKLLSGEYSDYQYDKRMIGLTKNFAAVLLAYAGEKLDEYDDDQLKGFVSKLVGHKLMSDLDLLDRYPLEEEISEE